MLCCEGCAFDFGWKPGDTSVPDECIGCTVIDGKPTNFKPKPKTNADRIRAMSDEELEAFLIEVDLERAGSPFITEWGKWLKQPAEGE